MVFKLKTVSCLIFPYYYINRKYHQSRTTLWLSIKYNACHTMICIAWHAMHAMDDHRGEPPGCTLPSGESKIPCSRHIPKDPFQTRKLVLVLTPVLITSLAEIWRFKFGAQKLSRNFVAEYINL